MFTGTYLKSFIKIGSVTAEILLTLSFCGGWVRWGWVGLGGVGWGGWCLHNHYIVKPNLVLRLGWGFDNLVKVDLSAQKPVNGPVLRPCQQFCRRCGIVYKSGVK